MKCQICKREFKNTSGFNQHAKIHVRRGELVRVETPKINQLYGFLSTVTYIKPKTTK